LAALNSSVIAVPWEKHKGIRTRPPGQWRQDSQLFEIAGLFYRLDDAKRFLAALPSQSYDESFLPLVARRSRRTATTRTQLP
jgi:hypothetical protein